MLLVIIVAIVCFCLSTLVELIFRDKLSLITIYSISSLIFITGFVVFIDRSVDFASEAFLLNYIQYCVYLIIRGLERQNKK